MIVKNTCHGCNKNTSFMHFLSSKYSLDSLHYILVRFRDSMEKLSRKKRLILFDVGMGQTPIQSLWPSTFYMKLVPNANCLPLEDDLEIASSNIKEQVYLGTPQELCMNIPYSRVSQTMVSGSHRLKASLHTFSESTHFSHLFMAGIWWKEQKVKL